jgi:ribonucleoside-diphosphate reductase alpha chain
MGATHAEKSTSKAGALNAVTASGGAAGFATSAGTTAPAEEAKFCAIDNPDCEACQ